MKLDESIRKRHLDCFKQAVDKYVPLIEKRTGIGLGNVFVKDWNEIYGKRYKKLENKAYARYSNSTIYVSFGWPIKMSLKTNSKEDNEKDVNLATVHELTHHLWETINKGTDPFYIINQRDKKDRKIWGEGYATYGQFDWFSDFYDFGIEYMDKLFFPREYKVGRRIIKGLVEKFGEEILLDVPLEWGIMRDDDSFNDIIKKAKRLIFY